MSALQRFKKENAELRERFEGVKDELLALRELETRIRRLVTSTDRQNAIISEALVHASLERLEKIKRESL